MSAYGAHCQNCQKPSRYLLAVLAVTLQGTFEPVYDRPPRHRGPVRRPRHRCQPARKAAPMRPTDAGARNTGPAPMPAAASFKRAAGHHRRRHRGRRRRSRTDASWARCASCESNPVGAPRQRAANAKPSSSSARRKRCRDRRPAVSRASKAPEMTMRAPRLRQLDYGLRLASYRRHSPQASRADKAARGQIRRQGPGCWRCDVWSGRVWANEGLEPSMLEGN
jgi:hypothetical protein